MKALGPHRIIMVFNKAFGTTKDLPFDLGLKRVLPYEMKQETADRTTERNELSKRLEGGLRTIFEGLKAVKPEEIMGASSLGDQARELLVEAAQDTNGAIINRFVVGVGRQIETNGKTFGDNPAPRIKAIWQGALTQLFDNGFFRRQGVTDELYLVTDKGYRLADLLQNRQTVDQLSANPPEYAQANGFTEADCLLLLEDWLLRKSGSGRILERFDDVDKLANVPPGSAKRYLKTVAEKLGMGVDAVAENVIRIDYQRYE